MSGNCLVEVVWCIVVHIDQHGRKMAQCRLQKIIDATIRHTSTYMFGSKKKKKEKEIMMMKEVKQEIRHEKFEQ